MRYKAFDHGKGNVKWAVRYVLAEHNHQNEERGMPPEILRGNANDLLAVGNTIKNEWKYTSGVLSVSENPTPEQERELIQSFEEHCFAGMDESRRSVLWVKHKDHNHTEYHFIFNRIDLETGKAFNPMPPNQLHYFDKWMNHQNALNNWTRPDAHKNDVHIKNTDPNKILKMEAASELRTLIDAQLLKDRKDVIRHIDGHSDYGLKFKKQGDNYVTFTKIMDDGKEKSIRFRGGIFDVNNTYMYEKGYEPELVNQHWNADAEMIRNFEQQMLEAREAKALTHIEKYGEIQNDNPPLKELYQKGKSQPLVIDKSLDSEELEDKVDRLTWHSSTKQQKNFYMTFSKVYEPEDVENYKAWTSKNSDQHIHDSENKIHVKITGSTSTYNIGKNTSDEALTKMMLVDLKRRGLEEGENLSYVGSNHTLDNNFIICMARAQYQYNMENGFHMDNDTALIFNLSKEDNEILFKTMKTEYEMRLAGNEAAWTIADQIEKDIQENSIPVEQKGDMSEQPNVPDDYINDFINEHKDEPSNIKLIKYKMPVRFKSEAYYQKVSDLEELQKTDFKFPEVENSDLFPDGLMKKRAVASLGQDKINELENVYEAMNKMIKDFAEGVETEETKDWDVRDLVKMQENMQNFKKASNHSAQKAHALMVGILDSQRPPTENELQR